MQSDARINEKLGMQSECYLVVSQNIIPCPETCDPVNTLAVFVILKDMANVYECKVHFDYSFQNHSSSKYHLHTCFERFAHFYMVALTVLRRILGFRGSHRVETVLLTFATDK